MQNTKGFPEQVEAMFEDGAMTVTYDFTGGEPWPKPARGYGPALHAPAPVTWAGWQDHWMDDDLAQDLPEGVGIWMTYAFAVGVVAGACLLALL